MRLVWRAKEIIVLARNFLIRGGEDKGDVIWLYRQEWLQSKHVFHVVQVNELVHEAVRVARDVAERGVSGRRFVQTMDRHDGEELVERPMIRRGTKDRKVRQVFHAQQSPQIVELFGDVLGGLRQLVSLLAHVPEQDL